MFTREFLNFFETLAQNNNRQWFNDHRDEYQQHVVRPMLAFIEAMAPRLKKISPHFVADSRRNGGSMFRIYRDVRFSRDKSPYKLHAACHFRHELGKNAHAPGFYVHISPQEVVFGGGIWMPPSAELLKIRTTIVDNPNEWKRIKSAPKFKQYFAAVGGDSLKRPPKGFDAEHPHIDDLKRKSFYAMREESPEIILDDQFIDEVEATFKAAKPLIEYICYAQEIAC